MISISLCNQSTTFKDADLPALANALQIQVKRDFYPVWGIDAKIYYTPTGAHPTASHWALVIFDTSDQPGALGYHDLTPTGQPLGSIFAKTTTDNGQSVSVTASHELMEMLCDPDINLTAELDDATGAPSKFYAYEVADAVEDDSLGYPIVIPAGWTGAGTSVTVSDFVYPSWFESFQPVTVQFDLQKKVTAPFQLLTGGYIGFLDLANLGAGWQQQLAAGMSDQARALARPQPGSRRARRNLPRSEWMRSTYTPGTHEPTPAGVIVT